MKIDDILAEWQKDSIIDTSRISSESLNTPLLHHKYYTIYVKEKLVLEQLDIDYKTLYKERWKFYNKMGDPKEYDSYDSDDFFDRKLMKSDKDIFIEADMELLNHQKKISVQKEKIEMLKSILDMIKNRGFQIKNYIDYEKFRNGL